jgi:hypothetical protein
LISTVERGIAAASIEMLHCTMSLYKVILAQVNLYCAVQHNRAARGGAPRAVKKDVVIRRCDELLYANDCHLH